jgi:hypothetical protein
MQKSNFDLTLRFVPEMFWLLFLHKQVALRVRKLMEGSVDNHDRVWIDGYSETPDTPKTDEMALGISLLWSQCMSMVSTSHDKQS